MKKFEKLLKEINSGDNIQDDAYMLIHEDKEQLQKRRQQILNYLDKPKTQQNKTKRDRYKNELNKIRNQLANRTPSGKLSGGFDDVTGENIKSEDIPKTKADLLKKRQEYGITYDNKLKKTNITQDGLEKFARRSLNRKQIESGSNKPIELTKADLDKARERVIGGKEIKDERGKVIGTTTGKYGGKVSGQSTQQQQQQYSQSNARRNMNRTLNFKNFRQKLKNLSSKATEKLSKIKTSLNQKTSNFQKGLKDPSRGFGAYKKGKRAMLGNVARKRGLIGDIALATAIAYPFIQDARARRKNKEEGKPPIERISSKNTTDTGALYSTKTGKDIKFGFNASGKPPQGTVGSMFNKKVKSMVQSKLNTKEFDFRKKVT